MEITWYGHGCFRIRAKEATVVTDPCDRNAGYSLGRPTADVVTVSVDHPSHAAVGAVAGDPRVLNGPGEFEISGASVVGVATPRKDNGSRNIVYVIEVEDLRIGHLGAITQVPTTEQVEEMGAIDILLVPVGGGEGPDASLDAPPAAETVSLIEPKLVIPMHYKTATEKSKLGDLDRFLKEMGAKTSEKHAKIAVTKSSLPEETQVLVLEPKG